MFSSYREAFADPIKSQLDELGREAAFLIKKQSLLDSVQANQEKFGLEVPHTASYYQEPEHQIELNEAMNQDEDSFFNAQGGYTGTEDTEGGRREENLSSLIDTGSSLSMKSESLKSPSLGSSLGGLSISGSQAGSQAGSHRSLADSLLDSPRLESLGLSDDDSVFSDDAISGIIKSQTPVNLQTQSSNYQTHDYYISRFLDGLYQPQRETQDDQAEVFQHLATCDYCKTMVKQKMTAMGQTQTLPSLTPPSPMALPSPSKTTNLPIVVGNEVKTVLGVLFVGIVMILVLDLFVKLRK